MKRRAVTLGSVFVVVLTLLAAAFSKPAEAAVPKTEGRTLNIMSNGGYYLENLRKYIIEPFEKKTGAKVLVTEAFSAAMLNRLRAEKASPTVDLISIGEFAAVSGRTEGLFQKIDPSLVPSLKDLGAQFKNADGYGIQSVSGPIVIVYNKNRVKVPPAGWADFWQSQFKGKVVIADIDNFTGVQFLVTAARIAGGGEKNIDPGFGKMKELKPNLSYIYKGEGQEVPHGLAKGDIWISHMMLVKAMELLKENAPVGVVIPKEGAHPQPYTLEIVNGSKNKDLAHTFLDIALGVEAQEGFAKALYVTPSNTKAKIEGELAKVLPKPQNLMSFDWVTIAAERSKWAERWQREIAQ